MDSLQTRNKQLTESELKDNSRGGKRGIFHLFEEGQTEETRNEHRPAPQATQASDPTQDGKNAPLPLPVHSHPAPSPVPFLAKSLHTFKALQTINCQQVSVRHADFTKPVTRTTSAPSAPPVLTTG